MMSASTAARLAAVCALVGVLVQAASGAQQDAQERLVGSIHEARAAQGEAAQEESYQRVYEAFTRLVQSVSNNSLGNARRLVTRLNQLVGPAPGEPARPAGESAASGERAPAPAQRLELAPPKSTSPPAPQPAPAPAPQPAQTEEQRTEQVLQRLDQVNKQTDPHTLRQLQDDVNRLVGTLSDAYLRNVRRVIERVNKTLGSGAPLAPSPAGALHQSGAGYDNGTDGPRQPGFPGWDELIVAVDRMQKSLASFVRSSTKLITAGR